MASGKPGAVHVEQVAELTQAIIDEYNRHGLARSSTAVTIWHFRALEQTLTKWTGFDEAIKRFVRHGDVVAIGNLESFVPGLRDFGFEETRGWRMFGLQDMFGMKCFVHKQSRHRIVLVGFSECFWGDASAQYVLDIIETELSTFFTDRRPPRFSG